MKTQGRGNAPLAANEARQQSNLKCVRNSFMKKKKDLTLD
jgi:hypothetical protein